MTKKQKTVLYRIIISAVLLVLASVLPLSGIPRLIAFLIPYCLIGYDVLIEAVSNIIRGQVFDEEFLMAIATVGAFGTRSYAEAVFVMLFYQVGELFQSYAVGKSRKSISALMDIRPDYANVERNGQLEQVDPEEVAVGEIVTVNPGERIPLDGVVLEGSSSLNTAALTGESMPRDVQPGSEVISGCVNETGLLRVQVTKEYAQSTVARILDLVENSSTKKAKAENFITKFSRYYTPSVVIAALLLLIIPSLITGEWLIWLNRALVFLVVSCPCALVISIPLTFFGGIGGASRNGILVKGGNYLEALSEVDTVVLDKTGTLTEGSFFVTGIHPQNGISEEQLLEYAAIAESTSSHPIAVSLKKAYGKELDLTGVESSENYPGKGISVVWKGTEILAGNQNLMKDKKIDCPDYDGSGTVVHVCADGSYAGYLVISDKLKEGAVQALAKMKEAGVSRIVMLTGDNQKAAEQIAEQTGVDAYYAHLLPQDKVEKVEELLQKETLNHKLCFVGDGINDAPVLARADIGIAMGAMGADAAIEAADIVLMDDKLEKIAEAVRISRRTLRIVKENIVFALGVKFLILILAAIGYASMWLAAFGDVGVAVIAILNAMRTLKKD